MITTATIFFLIVILFIVQGKRIDKIKKNLQTTAEAVNVLQNVELERLMKKLTDSIKNKNEREEPKKGKKTSRKPSKN